MDIIDSIEKIEKLIKENEMVLIYFGDKSWSVVKDLKPKVLAMLEEYPKVKKIYVDGDASPNTAAHFNIFAYPAILVYVDGKESIREAKHISLVEIEGRIARYYNLLF